MLEKRALLNLSRGGDVSVSRLLLRHATPQSGGEPIGHQRVPMWSELGRWHPPRSVTFVLINHDLHRAGDVFTNVEHVFNRRQFVEFST
jgi:hypothetical protein